jgi:hypothetical protein
MTIFLTILSGVLVFVLGQILLIFVVQPINRQIEAISEVADFLIFYANKYTNPGREGLGLSMDDKKEEALKEVSNKARALASKLIVCTQAIPFYKGLVRIKLARDLENIQKASQGLFYLSNNLFQASDALDNYHQSQEIAEALAIYSEFRPDVS